MDLDPFEMLTDDPRKGPYQGGDLGTGASLRKLNPLRNYGITTSTRRQLGSATVASGQDSQSDSSKAA